MLNYMIRVRVSLQLYMVSTCISTPNVQHKGKSKDIENQLMTRKRDAQLNCSFTYYLWKLAICIESLENKISSHDHD
jgi:hypothetical protein